MAEEITYKRFLLFSYSEYYPGGGLGDVVLEFETLEDFNKWLPDTIPSEHAYLFDCVDRKIVWDMDES